MRPVPSVVGVDGVEKVICQKCATENQFIADLFPEFSRERKIRE